MNIRRSLSALLFLLTICSPAFAQSLLLKNGKVCDPSRKTVVKKDVLIVDGHISAHNEIDPAHRPRILDVSGKWIIPALIDLHVHCGGNVFPDGSHENLGPHQTAKKMLYCGVVAYLDLAYGNAGEFFKARDEQRAEPKKFSNECDIYGVGTPFMRWNLTKENAAGEVDYYIRQWKPDVIKLIYGRNTLDRTLLETAIKAANHVGVKTVVHIGSWEHAGDAIRAGASAVTHFFDDECVPDELVKQWSKSRTVSIPTMAVQCDLAKFVDHPALLKTPLLQELEKPVFLRTYKNISHFSDKARETLKWQREDTEHDFESFRKLSRAGVPMLAGSDTDNHGTFQGFSLHREIKLMQDAGYSPWDALAAGTTRAAAFLGRPGGIESGAVAELLVLDGDPTVDVANTQKIFAVVHHGVLIDRHSLLD